MKATEERKAAVDANGCRTAVSVEVESSVGTLRVSKKPRIVKIPVLGF